MVRLGKIAMMLDTAKAKARLAGAAMKAIGCRRNSRGKDEVQSFSRLCARAGLRQVPNSPWALVNAHHPTIRLKWC